MQSVLWAVCAQHGGRYQVLFDRYAAPRRTAPGTAAAARPEPAGATCVAHPRQPSVTACTTCSKRLCALCSFEVGGSAYCSDCAVPQSGAAASGGRVCPSCSLTVPSGITRCDCGHDFNQLNLTAAASRRGPVSLGPCADHPEVAATTRCKLCGKSICSTCDFAFPGGVHVCPSCVDQQSSEDISPKRKRLSYIALALALWSTILFVMLFAGAFNEMLADPENAKAADVIITNIILWPLLIGTALSLSALDKKLRNTMLMKAVAWWNGVVCAIFLLIVIAANVGLIE